MDRTLPVRAFLIVSLSALSYATLGSSGTETRGNGHGQFAAFAPDFKVKDPTGVEHNSTDLFGKTGMLIMITVPNLTQYEKQKAWDKYVEKHPWPERGAPQRVLLEDLSQQTTYKEKVRGMMKQCYKPEKNMIVAVDEDGSIRRAFGVMNNETVILLVDSSGRIIHNESDDVEPDSEAASRLMRQVRQLAESQGSQARLASK